MHGVPMFWCARACVLRLQFKYIKCVAPFLNHVYHFKFVFSLICLYFPPELDRDMDGFTYRANDKLVDTRPLVNLKIVRSETGHSHLGYSFSGLKVSWFIRSCSRVLRLFYV